MTETPGRIRWEDNERRWDGGGSILGRAGTREDWLFQITQANNDPDDEALALMLQLPGADHRASEITQDGSLEALKAKAEEWLEEFVSSLGAAFPAAATLPQRDSHGMLDITCDACGATTGTNCRDDNITCAECGAHRCPHCGGWFGED